MSESPVARKRPTGPEAPSGEPRRRGGFIWKSLTIGLGMGLILVGIVGLFLPGLQGILTILAGLAVLSPHSRRARWILRTIKEKLRLHRSGSGGGHTGQARAETERTVPRRTETRRTATRKEEP